MKRKHFLGLCILFSLLVIVVGLIIHNDYVALTGVFATAVYILDVIENRPFLDLQETIKSCLMGQRHMAILYVLMLVISAFNNVYLFWGGVVVSLFLKGYLIYYFENRDL